MMVFFSNQSCLFKIIIGFRIGFAALLLNIFKNKIFTINLTKNWNLYLEMNLKYIYPLFYFLKKHSLMLFSFLMDLICFEILGVKYKYVLIYTLLSVQLNIRLNVKTKIDLNTKLKVLSLVSLYLNTCWAEREIFDFFGLYFFFNKDLRRLLLDYGFKGYPLRKNFPLTGFIELYYDDSLKKIIYEKVDLAVEYRKLVI